jgi:hypothetical protein
MLDLFVRLPFDALPGRLADDVLVRLGITAGPIMGLVAVISLSIYSRYNLSQARHLEIRLALAEKNSTAKIQALRTPRSK